VVWVVGGGWLVVGGWVGGGGGGVDLSVRM
jgi:hypothetical protein